MIASVADLVAFLKQFHRHWLNDPTLATSLIPPDLPPPLATLYRELGGLIDLGEGPDDGCPAPFSTQDGLMPLSRLKRVEGMVEFAWENQGNWSARCPLGRPDPPVYSNAADVWSAERRGFVPVCDSLAHFLTTLCLQEAVMSCLTLAALRTDRPPTEVLTVLVEPLWLNGRYVSGEPDHHFYVSADRDVLVMDWAGVWVGSPSRDVTELVAEGIDVQSIG